VWTVKRWDEENKEIKIADVSNNPTKTLTDALTNPQDLIYNYLQDI
jgi:hypothetical protein